MSRPCVHRVKLSEKGDWHNLSRNSRIRVSPIDRYTYVLTVHFIFNKREWMQEKKKSKTIRKWLQLRSQVSLIFFLGAGERRKGRRDTLGTRLQMVVIQPAFCLAAQVLCRTLLLQTSSVGCARKPMWSFHLTGKFNHTQEIAWLWWIIYSRQGWPSGESTYLPPMWPGFDFRTRRHTWIEFVGSLLCYERFFPGYSGFPLSPKTNICFDLLWFVERRL